MPLDRDFKRKSRHRFLEEAKTGDIITVAYGSKRAKLIKVFTGSMWAHSCVVVKPESKRAYVLEVSRYGERRGIMVTELKRWLKYNREYIVAVRPYLGEPIMDDKVQEFLARHEGVREQMFVVDWLAAMVKRRYPVSGAKAIEEKPKLFCSELVCHFLQHVGVVKKKYHPSGYKPWELLYDKLPLVNKDDYRTPSLLV